MYANFDSNLRCSAFFIHTFLLFDSFDIRDVRVLNTNVKSETPVSLRHLIRSVRPMRTVIQSSNAKRTAAAGHSHSTFEYETPFSFRLLIESVRPMRTVIQSSNAKRTPHSIITN